MISITSTLPCCCPTTEPWFLLLPPPFRRSLHFVPLHCSEAELVLVHPGRGKEGSDRHPRMVCKHRRRQLHLRKEHLLAWIVVQQVGHTSKRDASNMDTREKQML